jgi:hypothetical protein
MEQVIPARLKQWFLRSGRSLVISLCLLTGIVPRCCAQAAAAPPLEYQVKAAFLLNFTKFIEWPRAESAETDALARICILGDDPFGVILDQMVEGEVLNGRKLMIRRLHHQTPKSCEVLFFSKADEKDVPGVLSDVGPGVLTVGEGENFLRDGGAIAFVIENRRVRFDVNQTAAGRARLKISSRLLTVARSVAK